jgi:hypothetical protein
MVPRKTASAPAALGRDDTTKTNPLTKGLLLVLWLNSSEPSRQV